MTLTKSELHWLLAAVNRAITEVESAIEANSPGHHRSIGCPAQIWREWKAQIRHWRAIRVKLHRAAESTLTDRARSE
jgi:hypothetical protein